MNTKRPINVIVVSLLVLAAMASTMVCSLFTPRPSATEPAGTPTSSTPAPTPPPGVYPPSFARFRSIAVTVPQKFNNGEYTLPVALQGVQYTDEVQLSEAQRALLSQNGFVVLAPQAGQYQEFYQIYESGRYGERPVFITTDSIYHVYHLIFDKMLRDLETESFINTLGSLTTTMLQASMNQYNALIGSPLEEPALRNVAYFAVGGAAAGPACSCSCRS